MTDENQPVQPNHAFAAGQEVLVSVGGEQLNAKIVAVVQDESGQPAYQVVYATRALVSESALSALDG